MSYFKNPLLLFLLALFIHSVYAESFQPEQQKQLITLLNTHGNQAKSGLVFYLAGVDCYQHQLKALSYLKREDVYILFFNDARGNCVFNSIYLGNQLPDKELAGKMCAISDTFAARIFTPDAINAAKTAAPDKPNPVILALFSLLRDCLKPISAANVLSELQSSSQVTGKREHD